MIARSLQFLRIEPDNGTAFRLADLISPRAEAVLAFLFGLLAFLPYPAIPVGSNSALQTGNIISLVLILPCLALPWKGQSFYLAPLLVVPYGLSLFKVALTDGGNLPICFKSLLVSALCCVALMAAQRVAPRQTLKMLAGIAIATILHSVIGLWQMYGIAHGQFPLLGLYINPSFFSVQENAGMIVRFIRRPFGLFPEPSAMSASLAPWTIFWLAEACGLVRLRQPPSRALRALFVTAAISGITLIILSRSGHAMITLAAVAAMTAIVFLRSRATARNYLVLLGVSCILLPICAWLATAALGERFSGGDRLGDASWQTRATSLWIGFSLWSAGNIWTWLFGMGPGLTTEAIWRTARFHAVWSVLLPYVYQTGVLGAGVIAICGYHLARVWRQTRFNSAFSLMLLVWLVGITITTSYVQLLPIWLAMGWLTVWPSICTPSKDLAAAMVTPPRRWKSADLDRGISRAIASRESRLSLAPPTTANGAETRIGARGEGQ